MGSLQRLFQVLAGGQEAEEALHVHRKVVALEQALARLHPSRASHGHADQNGNQGDPCPRSAELHAAIAEHKVRIASPI